MAAQQDRGVDWRTWSEARADFDRALETVEKRLERRIEEMEERILERIDDTRAVSLKVEDRVRTLEREVTELRTTNRLLAAVFTGVIALLSLALAAVAAWR